MRRTWIPACAAVLLMLSIDSATACMVDGLESVTGSAGAVVADRTCNTALERGRVGEEFHFQDPKIEVMGTVTAGVAYRNAKGVFCRRVTMTVVAPTERGLRRRQWSGVGCRRGHADWTWERLDVRLADDDAPTAGMRPVPRRF